MVIRRYRPEKNFTTTVINMVYVFVACLVLVVHTQVSSACPSICSCYGGNKMICSNINLTPQLLRNMIVPVAIKDITFTRNKLSEISSEILHPFKHAGKLEISHNLIREIPPNTFEGFRNLTALSLKRNQIRELLPESLSGLSNLLHLKLSENKLSYLYEGIFDKLTSVESIRLAGNNINEIPNDVFTGLKSLRDLFIGKNKISRLGNRAFQNMSINKLDLYQNQIKRIPTGTFTGVKISNRVILLLNLLECSCHDVMTYAIHLKNLKNKLWARCNSPINLKEESIMLAYLSTNCTKCDLNPCHNGANCSGNKTSFRCSCTDYFKGQTCQTSICQPEIRYIKKIVNLPSKTVLKYTDNKSEEAKKENAVLQRKTKDLETKVMILYGICSIELVIILCFVGLLILGKYQDWRLMKRYNKKNSPHVLEKFRKNTEHDNANGFISISELVSYT